MRTRDDIPKETLVIDNWDSHCNNCGGGADPHEKTHEKDLPGYSSRGMQQGCGIEWKYVSTNYVGNRQAERIKEMRPDLEYVGYDVSEGVAK